MERAQLPKRKQLIEIVCVCAVFLIMAWYVESTDQKLDEENRIARAKPGGGSTSVELTLDADGVFKDYAYSLDVSEMVLTEEEARAKLAQAQQEINDSFFAEGEDANRVTRPVCMKETYCDKLVCAEWTLNNYHVMDVDGRMIDGAVPQEGVLVQADVALSCGGYRESYSFGFMVYPEEQSAQEELLTQVRDAVEQEQERAGSAYLNLPERVDGYTLRWTQAEEHLVFKVLLFEVIILVLLYFVTQERKREREKLRREEMMLDYAEVVNKLLILLGSGMSLKQAWNRISARYLGNRDKKRGNVRQIYEEMVITNYEIEDGESERLAYQKFGERTGLGAYYRLVRILIQSAQTGSRGLCQLLEQEAEAALEERRALAKKLGEEAGTKMLLPLVTMLGIVIAIILVPALQTFSV